MYSESNSQTVVCMKKNLMTLERAVEYSSPSPSGELF